MAIVPAFPFNLVNGTTADATQVMANFNSLYTSINANAAENGVNNTITHLTGLTTPLSVSQGGTGGYTQPAAANNILPNQTSNAGKYLSTDGTNVAWTNPATVQPGFISMFGGSSAPAGYLECDGSAVSRTTYAALFAAIGTTWGVGDGTSTFNLPDMRGVFARGWDHGRGFDSGRAFASYQADDIKAHNHTANVTDPTHAHNFRYDSNLSTGGATPGNMSGSSGGIKSTDAAATGISVAVANTGGTETRPKNVAVMYVIKT